MAHLEYVVSAADTHSRANAGRSTAEAVGAVPEIAGLAHGAGGSLEVIIATAWDCPFDGRTPISRTVDVARASMTAGADQLCLGDTIGTTTPLRVVQLLDAVRRACPGVSVGVHFHDTRGTGQANALAAVQAGVDPAGLLDRRPRRLPVRARRQRQHRHRGTGLHARGVRRARPAWTSTPCWPPPASPSTPWGTSCPARSTAPAAGRSPATFAAG